MDRKFYSDLPWKLEIKQLILSPRVSNVIVTQEVVVMIAFHELCPLGESAVIVVFSSLLIRESSLIKCQGRMLDYCVSWITE